MQIHVMYTIPTDKIEYNITQYFIFMFILHDLFKLLDL